MEVFGNFWCEKFWLPDNITWKHIDPSTSNKDGVIFRNYYDLCWSIPLAILITITKSIAIRYFFIPFGKYLQIKSTKTKPPSKNVVLEKMFKKYPKQQLPSSEMIVSIIKQTDMSTREVERWWRRRRAQNKVTRVEKFADNCWRCTFYFFSFTFGLCVLWNRDWVWKLDVIKDYPYHSIDNGIWWYYNIAAAFYLSLSFTHFFESRHKDFLQMFVHHMITLTLIAVSWICNGIRGGALIVFVHDVADIFLDSAKAAVSAKAKQTCNVLFVLFVIVWVITRLGIYGKIVYNGVFGFSSLYPLYPLYFVISGLTISLFILHLLWTYMIIQVVVKMTATKAVDDVRSSSEEDSDGVDLNTTDESEQTEINGNEVLKTKTNGRKSL